MRIDSRQKIRSVAGEYIMILQGGEESKLNRVVSFNNSAKFLWDAMEGKDFSREDALQAILDEYDVSSEVAILDIEKWIDALRSYGLLFD